MNKSALMWIAVPFVVVLSLFLGYILTVIAGKYILYTIGLAENKWYAIALVEIPANISSGYLAVALSSVTAPSKKIGTALIVMILLLCWSSINLFIVNFITYEYLQNIGQISVAVGAVVGYLKAKEFSN